MISHQRCGLIIDRQIRDADQEGSNIIVYAVFSDLPLSQSIIRLSLRGAAYSLVTLSQSKPAYFWIFLKCEFRRVHHIPFLRFGVQRWRNGFILSLVAS